VVLGEHGRQKIDKVAQNMHLSFTPVLGNRIAITHSICSFPNVLKLPQHRNYPPRYFTDQLIHFLIELG